MGCVAASARLRNAGRGGFGGPPAFLPEAATFFLVERQNILGGAVFPIFSSFLFIEQRKFNIRILLELMRASASLEPRPSNVGMNGEQIQRPILGAVPLYSP